MPVFCEFISMDFTVFTIYIILMVSETCTEAVKKYLQTKVLYETISIKSWKKMAFFVNFGDFAEINLRVGSYAYYMIIIKTKFMFYD